jgi:hypothetical protein
MGKKKGYKCACGETTPENFYPKRKSKCKKCILEGAKDKYANLSESDKKSYIEKQGKWQDDNFLQYRLLQARSRAKSKNLPCEIDTHYLEGLLLGQGNKCFYSGLEMELSRAGNYSASIDRVDSSKGYVKGNVIFVIWAVNTMKNDLDENEFLSIVEAIHQKQKSDFD